MKFGAFEMREGNTEPGECVSEVDDRDFATGWPWMVFGVWNKQQLEELVFIQ